MSEEKVALELPGKKKGVNGIKSLAEFAKVVMQICRQVGFRISARGW